MPKSQPSKRRRAQRRHVARPDREQATTAPPGAPASTSTPAPRTPPAPAVLHRRQFTHYEHIAGDLKRLGIISGALLAILIVLAIVL